MDVVRPYLDDVHEGVYGFKITNIHTHVSANHNYDLY